MRALLGAEEFGFATAPLVVMGCIMMRVCHLNTCPVGIATQDPELRKKFTGKPEFVENFFRFIAQEVRELMAELGFRTIDEMIGRADCLDIEHGGGPLEGARASTCRRSCTSPSLPATRGAALRARRRITASTCALDNELIRDAPAGARARGRRSKFTPFIRNADRTVGTMLGYEVTRRYGGAGLPDDTIRITFTGSAGQSFGAFVPRGMTMTLVGDANDGFGKGLSGGTLIVYPPTRVDVQVRGEHHHRQRRVLRRDERRGVTCAAWPASGSASATAARTWSSKASAITAAST